MRDTSELHEPVMPTTSTNPAIAAILLGAALAFSLTALLQPTVMGDGAEYYAMYLAWKNTLRPFMTDISWSEVDMLAKSGQIAGFVPVEALRAAFPALHVGATSDFNHFWLYSGLAALVHAAAWPFPLKLSAHATFIVTHWLLFTLTLLLAYRYFRFKGVAAAVALAALSPVVWFVDKVHTEFFTFCLTLSAMIVFLSRDYLLSALFLAIASTQNISFAAIAAVPFALHFFGPKVQAHQRWSRRAMLCAALAGLFVLLHPAYYFWRYGVITPQLLAGGADPGGNAGLFYIWLLDPDVGLLPNWPLGVAILLLIPFIGTMENISKQNAFLLLFAAAYLAINLFAQSSTQNLNSGATPGPARYATWYIPLFFPLLLAILDAWKRLRWLPVALVLACLVSLAYTLRFNHPRIGQIYLTPSPASLYLQKFAPALYDPPAEIFAERYGGMGEMPALAQARAVVGPDCRKILVFPGPGRDKVYGSQCPFAEEKVKALLAHRLGPLPAFDAPTYLRLTQPEAVSVMAACPSHIDFSTDQGFPVTVVKGFGIAEPHGRWTEGTQASISCVLHTLPGAGKPTRMRIATMAFVAGGHRQRVSASLDGEKPMELEYAPGEEMKTLEFDLSSLPDEPLRLRLRLPDAISPSELGINADTRKIAISVRSVDFE